MNKLTEWLTKPLIKEDINIPVDVGDTILVGKFKNKKMKIKDIGKDKHGMPTINGRKAATFRIHKTVNIFDEEEIKEGVNDPGIFKAVFLAGGPGSGKTYVAGGLFGIPKKVNVSAYGLKMVNQDTELENFLKKYFGSVDIDMMPDDLFRQLTDPKSSDYSGMRTHSKALSKQRLKQYAKGRLGVIIDGTGHRYKDVKAERQKLIDRAREEYCKYKSVYVSSNTPTYRAHRKLPKVQRPKGKRVTIFKPDDPRGFVYIFKDHMKSVNGWLYYYKVGASHDPQERLNQANTWGDFECLYESEMVDECASLEKEVHQALSKYRVKGEWFQCDKTFIINKIEELVDARKEQAVAEQKVS